MSKFFNNNNATVNAQAQPEEQNNKFGWLKTGALIVGGTAAAVGAAIGARRLYESFTEDRIEANADDLPEDLEDEDGTGMEEQKPSKETETSTEPESNSETIFTEVIKEDTSVENTPDGTEVHAPSEKLVDPVPGTFDPIEGYKLPEGRSWKSLVRKEIFEITKDLEDEMTKLEYNESPFVVRCANSVFNRVEDVEAVSDWERLYIDNLYKDFYSYVGYAMDAIADRYKKSHQFEDLALAKALFDEFVSSPLYIFRVGKKLKITLKELREEAKRMAASEEPKEVSDDVTNETNHGVTDEAVTPDESSTDPEVETAATVAEMAPVSEVTKDVVEDKEDETKSETTETETPKGVSEEATNASAIKEFKEKIAEVKRRVANDPIDARKYFNTDVKCYMFDDNIPASVKDDLKKLEEDIKDKIYDSASKRITSGKPAGNKRRGGKRSYKKNGRK